MDLTGGTHKKTSFSGLLFALSLIIFLINVDYTAIGLALPSMAVEFNASLGTLQWVITGYILSWALLIFPSGGLSAKYTTRQLCLAGLACFIFASLLASCATSSYLLIVARVLQGIAAAIYCPAVYGLIHCNIPENARGRAMGLLSLGVGLGLALGPFIGGALVTLWSWRGIFLLNLPVGLIALYFIYIQKDNQQLSENTFSLSKTSVALISFATMSFIFILNQWQVWPTHILVYSAWAAIAVIAVMSFIFLQKKIANPLIPLNLFKNRNYTACCIGIFLEQAAFSIIVLGTSLYLQTSLHYSPLNSSLIFLFLTVIFGIIAYMGGRWVDSKGLVLPTMSGMIIMGIGSILFAALPFSSYSLLICPILFVLGTGMGLAFIGLNTGVVKTVSQAEVGIATSVFMVLALIGNSFAITLTSLIFQQANIGRLSSITEVMLLNSILGLFAIVGFGWLTLRTRRIVKV